jgi:hypothetical protein
MTTTSRSLIFVACVLLLGAAPEAPSLEAEIARLFASLELERRADFRSEAGLCLSIEVRIEGAIDADPQEIERLVSGLVHKELEGMGARPLRDCPPSGTLAIEERARLSGAEWLLAVRVKAGRNRGQLAIELRRIDRGFWIPAPPQPEIHAFARSNIDPTAIASWAPPPAVEPVREPRSPRLVRQGRVDGHLLALAACDLDGDGHAELVALGEELIVFRGERGVPPIAHLSLAPLPRAKRRVRDPIGGVVCADLDRDGTLEIAIGHSDFERGLLVSVKRVAKSFRLEPKRELSAIPLAVLESGELLQAHPDEGRNRWAKELIVAALGGERTVDLGRPFYDLTASASAFVLGIDYELLPLSRELSLGASIGTSGVGAAILPNGVLVSTSSAASRGDKLFLSSAGAGARADSFSLPAPVAARAWVRSQESIDLWIAVRDDRGDQIMRLSLPEPAR